MKTLIPHGSHARAIVTYTVPKPSSQRGLHSAMGCLTTPIQGLRSVSNRLAQDDGGGRTHGLNSLHSQNRGEERGTSHSLYFLQAFHVDVTGFAYMTNGVSS